MTTIYYIINQSILKKKLKRKSKKQKTGKIEE